MDIYLAASSQRINEEKSSIFFFNTPLIQSQISHILRFQIGAFPFMYLGIPLSIAHCQDVLGIVFWIIFVVMSTIGLVGGYPLLGG